MKFKPILLIQMIKKYSTRKKLKGLLINSSIEHYFKFNNKEDSKFLTWLIYLGIIENIFF